MSPDHADLLSRIEQFEIDGSEPVALPFAARLARENGWPADHAARVVREYKRYVFLAVTSAGGPVCPSEDVDAAWHLHLTYTRSYWNRFCGEVLGRPLHHDPTRGGPAEARKHRAMYDRTRAAYRAAFGEGPPADIWPSTDERFGDDLRHRTVNTARNWVIPKRPVVRAVGAAAAVVALVSFVPGCVGAADPFALKGTDFFWLLVPALVGAVVVGRAIQWALRSPNPYPGDDEVELTWEEAAFVAGGPARLTAAAIARLVEAGAAEVSGGKQLVPAGGAADRLGPVERAVYDRLPAGNTAADLKAVRTAVESAFAGDAARLTGEGIALGSGRQFGVGCGAAVPLALVFFGLAVPRLMMGTGTGKPVGYLVAVMVAGGMAGLVALWAGSGRFSRRGQGLLAGMRSRHAGLGTGGAGLAVALFGTAALAGSPLEGLRAWYPRQTDAGSGGCAGGGCGGGGCGGGGCGGGGCGGCG